MAALLAAVWASACGDGATEPGPDAPRVVAVVVTSVPDGPIAPGATVQLGVEATDQHGRVLEDPPVTWESDDVWVARVDTLGEVTAVGVGTTVITARVGNVAATAQLTVADPAYTVLLALYFAAGGEDWTDDAGWGGSPVLGSWHGVETDGAGRVVGLDLASNNLTGRIPPELGDLRHLRRLDLSGNNLTGVIPPELGNLANLEVLWLQHNELEGTIPAGLGGLARLEQLWLSHNDLWGSLPEELGQLSRLRWLLVSSNDLSGPLPLSLPGTPIEVLGYGDTVICVPGDASLRAWLATVPSHSGTGFDCTATTDRAALEALYNATGGRNWHNNNNWLTDAPLDDWYGVDTDDAGRVVRLDLSGKWDEDARRWILHGLSGPIPPQLASLDSLQYLSLTFNRLTGQIPPELGSLVGLDSLQFTANELSGPIPPELGGLVELKQLLLGANQLSGNIPSELGNLAEMRDLSIGVNRLTGAIPPELGRLSKLTGLYLYENDLSGPIPSELGDLANLEVLWLFENELSGTIPPELGDLANLESFAVSQNRLTGRIPPEFGRLSKLRSVYLYENDLSGPIPSELGNLTNLEILSASRAALTGPIPSELGRLSNLRSLYLYDNDLSGTIPPELGNLVNMEVLSAERNDLTGTIPPELGRLSKLRSLWLHENELSGPIPSELGNLVNLRLLTLHDNQLTGTLPAEIGNMASLGAGLGIATGIRELDVTAEWEGAIHPAPRGASRAAGGRMTSLAGLYIHLNPMSGSLPLSMTNLSALSWFWFQDTELCAPPDTVFQSWLAGLDSVRTTGLRCDSDKSKSG